jgi:hypothetical protein
MLTVIAFDHAGFTTQAPPEMQMIAAQSLERGNVLVFPRVNFELAPAERRFLSSAWSDGRAKNISFESGDVRGARGSPADRAALAAMIGRFAADAATFVGRLFPRYAPYVKRARTSFRPQPAVGRSVSWRKDDSRLHVDAFPSRPSHGERILRVFSNVNPEQDRVWRVGEPFEKMAARMLPRVRRQVPGSAAALAALGITKGLRTEYDHLMLGLHDQAKADILYQRECDQQVVRFAPGTTWLCFSDQVMHAAVSGQFMLEQTIHLPASALHDFTQSPLAVLRRLTGRPLAPQY